MTDSLDRHLTPPPVPRPGEVVITSRRTENERRGEFEDEFNAQLPLISEGKCDVCGFIYKRLIPFLVHRELHLVLEADMKTQLAAIRDIRSFVYPSDEKEAQGVLTAEVRAQMLESDTKLLEKLSASPVAEPDAGASPSPD